MRVTKVRLYSAMGTDIIDLSLLDPSSFDSPYVARQITGLDAEEIIPKYYNTGPYNSMYDMSLAARTMVFSIFLNPNYNSQSYSSLRDALYRSIASNRTGMIEVQFYEEDTLLVSIWGFVTRVENDMFQRRPEVKLTIKCPDPMFRSPTIIDEFTETTDELFTITDTVSTAPHGLQFSGKFVAAADEFILSDQTTPAGWSFNITPGIIVHPLTYDEVDGFIEDDELWVSSLPNEKYVYMVRDGATIHLAHKIVPGSVWPLIFPTSTAFKVAPASFYWYEFRHYRTYWGV